MSVGSAQGEPPTTLRGGGGAAAGRRRRQKRASDAHTAAPFRDLSSRDGQISGIPVRKRALARELPNGSLLFSANLQFVHSSCARLRSGCAPCNVLGTPGYYVRSSEGARLKSPSAARRNSGASHTRENLGNFRPSSG